MKQKIVPTSPKSPYQELINHKNRSRFQEIFLVIICSLIFGSISGLLGFVIIANVPSNWPLLGKISPNSYLVTQQNNILFSTKSGDPFLLQKSPWTLDYIAAIYNGEPSVETPAEFLGNAVIVTSDGWLVAQEEVLKATNDLKTLKIILPNGLTTTISESINDDLTKTVFLKVDANNLSVINFPGDQHVLIGQTLFLVEKQLGAYIIYERRLTGEYFRDNVRRFTSELTSAPVFDGAGEVPAGLPVFASDATFVGFLSAGEKLLQGNLLEGALKSILTNKTIKRYQEKIQYINIARLTETERQQRQLPLAGFYIISAPESSELKTNDVILSINNNDIDFLDDLSVLIHSYSVDTVLALKILREKKEVLISFKM